MTWLLVAAGWAALSGLGTWAISRARRNQDGDLQEA